MRDNGLYFVIGLVVGLVVGYEIAKTKSDKDKDEEVNALEEYYKEKMENVSDVEEEIKNTISKAGEIAKQYKYDATPSMPETNIPEVKPSKKSDDGPYQIAPELFGEFDDYEQISLKYYENGVLVDDEEILDDIEIDDTVGLDYAEHFGEYEMDALYIRNDEKRCDYEILKEIGVFVEPDSD